MRRRENPVDHENCFFFKCAYSRNRRRRYRRERALQSLPALRVQIPQVCSPRISRARLLEALERDTGGDFTRSSCFLRKCRAALPPQLGSRSALHGAVKTPQRYAPQGFGDSHGSVERCLWVVDPDKGAARAACVLVPRPRHSPCDVSQTGDLFT